MRNTGWYIPYWRKLKKKGKQERPGAAEITRSDEQLEAIRRRWIERYRRTVRALDVLGLSMGSNRGDVQARYNQLREAGTVRPGELEEAYRYLSRVLPPLERRKKRPPPSEGTSKSADSVAESPRGVAVVEVYAEAVELDVETTELDVEVYAEAVELDVETTELDVEVYAEAVELDVDVEIVEMADEDSDEDAFADDEDEADEPSNLDGALLGDEDAGSLAPDGTSQDDERAGSSVSNDRRSRQDAEPPAEM